MREHTAHLLVAIPHQHLCIRSHPLPPCNSPAGHHIEADDTARTIEMVTRRLSVESETGTVGSPESDRNITRDTTKEKTDVGKRVARQHGLRINLEALQTSGWESVRSC